MARSKPDRRTGQLFRSISGQDEMFEKSYEEEVETRRSQPVKCLGMTFESDEERREHFLEKTAPETQGSRVPQDRGFPDWRRRGYPGFVRSAILHGLSKSVHRGFCHTLWKCLWLNRALQSRGLCCGCERRQEQPSLQCSYLPYESPSQGTDEVYPPLHPTWRFGSRRFL